MRRMASSPICPLQARVAVFTGTAAVHALIKMNGLQTIQSENAVKLCEDFRAAGDVVSASQT